LNRNRRKGGSFVEKRRGNTIKWGGKSKWAV